MTAHERAAPFTGGLAPSWQIPWALVLLLAAAFVALRRRDWPSLSLALIALLTAATAWVSAARVVDEPYGYLLRWTWAVGAIAWLAVGWTALRALSDAHPVSRLPRTTASAAAIVVMVLALATTVTGLRASLPNARTERALHHLDPALMAAARHAPGPILVQNASDLGSALLANGVLLRLNEQGIDARFAADIGVPGVGEHHTIAPPKARTTIVVAADNAIHAYDANPAYRPLATYDALSPDERAYVTDVANQITNDLGPVDSFKGIAAWGHEHPAAFQRFNELNARGDRAALFIAVENP
jgi:hypothetical protein